jgi:hypothetical protein
MVDSVEPVGGVHSNALSPLGDGQQKALQLDQFGRLIVTSGSGSPGAAGGDVQSVQGVDGMIPFTMREADQQSYVVGSNQADFLLGNDAAGAYLKRLVVVPITNAGVGNVAIKDGNGAGQTIFVGAVLTDSKPVQIDLGLKSTVGGWKVTTGALLTVWAIGKFS